MSDVPYAHESRFRRFQDLMRVRVREILLVSSLYDSFILAEDGGLYESLLNEYIGLGLTHMPNITRVSSTEEALQLARMPGRFDLIITSLRLEDGLATEFAERVRQVGIDTPLVLLTYDSRELAEIVESGGALRFDKVFMWQGDFRVFLAIIKFIEDRANIEEDTRLVGVQSIVLVEDSVRFYSSYLPRIYTAVLEHTAELIAEAVNPAHRLLRLRARPKIILCGSYEEAWSYCETYHDTILGVVSDIEFPHQGELDPEAGFELAANVLRSHDDIPVLLQSHDPRNRERAASIGASFIRKDSPSLLHDLKAFMVAHFGFGEFVFRLANGDVVGRAADLRALEEQLYIVPDESVAFHGERNHFSTWLKSRTEFLLAHRLRPVEVSAFDSISAVREHLIASLREHRREQQGGSVVDFDPDTFDEARSFARIGGGSMGGKARGLAFAHRMISAFRLEHAVEGVRISVPSSLILGTDVFDRFVEENQLWDLIIDSTDDAEIEDHFLRGRFSAALIDALTAFLQAARFALSVRSSSLLEDSQFMPFAGVYDTLMLPNSHPDPEVRLDQLLEAIKRVYASTFKGAARRYVKSTPYRLEEERMAVIIQKLVGVRREDRFYPDFSGVARSHNFYPIGPLEPGDGIASVALGLGKQVVEGGAALRFSPRHPRHLVQFSRVEDVLKYSQKDFWALSMIGPAEGHAPELVQYPLDIAEQDGALANVGSTYDHENHVIYDDVSRAGVRLVTFAPILKHDVFPLPEILDRLMTHGARGMSAPVEIEFAVNLRVPAGQPAEFFLLQMRPMVVEQNLERIDWSRRSMSAALVHSNSVLGHGVVDSVRDIVVVDIESYDRTESMRIAREVADFNDTLTRRGIPYVLIGVGRWGSADPWLGIPVRWEDISGARVIVEAGMKDVRITPSQGTHFFQNITSSRVGYITASGDARARIDWQWMRNWPAAAETTYVRHLRFDSPVTILMDGHRGQAAILRPETEAATVEHLKQES